MSRLAAILLVAITLAMLGRSVVAGALGPRLASAFERGVTRLVRFALRVFSTPLRLALALVSMHFRRSRPVLRVPGARFLDPHGPPRPSGRDRDVFFPPSRGRT